MCVWIFSYTVMAHVQELSWHRGACLLDYNKLALPRLRPDVNIVIFVVVGSWLVPIGLLFHGVGVDRALKDSQKISEIASFENRSSLGENGEQFMYILKHDEVRKNLPRSIMRELHDDELTEAITGSVKPVIENVSTTFVYNTKT